jgi:cytochrome c-type biogenesis protein CcsB
MEALESASFSVALVCIAIASLVVIAYLIIVAKDKDDTRSKNLSKVIIGLLIFCFASLTVSIIARTIETGHGPFSSMYEFSTAFAWGIAGFALFYRWKFKQITVSGLSTLAVLAVLIFANNLPSKPIPLEPALQQSFLLSTHVASAIIAYGAFCIGFIAAIMFLIQQRNNYKWLPDSMHLDRISYNTVIIGFPFLTLVIVLGAIWAERAWGTYWSWDPKETASLVTWLFYAGYMHTRILRHWSGNRSAILLIIAFAAVIFTFLGNYIFTGLHVYG